LRAGTWRGSITAATTSTMSPVSPSTTAWLPVSRIASRRAASDRAFTNSISRRTASSSSHTEPGMARGSLGPRQPSPIVTRYQRQPVRRQDRGQSHRVPSRSCGLCRRCVSCDGRYYGPGRPLEKARQEGRRRSIQRGLRLRRNSIGMVVIRMQPRTNSSNCRYWDSTLHAPAVRLSAPLQEVAAARIERASTPPVCQLLWIRRCRGRRV
jgi:hypothetical protein